MTTRMRPAMAFLLAGALGVWMPAFAAEPAPAEEPAKPEKGEKGEKDKDQPISASLEIRGSGAMGQLARGMAELFMADHPDIVVTVQNCGANQALKSLIIGTCDMAMGTDEVPEEMAKLATDRGVKLKRTDVYRDALAVIVHADNPVANLTLKQLRDIFRGAVTNWSAVGGADAPIEVLTPTATSAAYEVFKRRVLGVEAVMSPKATLVTGKQMKESLKENAIAFVSIAQMTKNAFKGLSIEGVPPSSETVKTGKYPIVREMSLYQREPASPLVDQVVEYFLAPDKGQKQILAAGNVPVKR